MKKYIFTSDYQAVVNQVGGPVTAPIAIFKKGDIYPLENFLNGFIFSMPIPNNPQHLNWGYFIPKSVVKEYNVRNVSTLKDVALSSYTGKVYPTYRVKINQSSTFGNLAGQTLYVPAGSIGTVQARKSPVVFEPESDPNNWLIDVRFNGQHIVIPAKGPVYNGNLKQYFSRGEFTFLPFDRNVSSIKSNTVSSYLGEGMVSQDKEENLKNAFAVIGALFIALIIYVYIMEFKNLQ